MNTETLEFSIVIPTYNRPDRLEKCLQSIAQLAYPHDRFEVIVVDDGSQMPLTSIVEPFNASLSLRLIRQNNAGPASARNTGAAIAQGHYLVFTDDDCQVHSQWLVALAEATAETPTALIGGYTINALPENPYSTASQLLIDYLYCYYNDIRGKVTFFASNNFAVPRDIFQKLGGFDTSFPLAAGEDREFCDRWLQQELPMAYLPKMMIYHAHHLSLKRFWRQHFNYGRGAYCFHRAKARRQNGQVKIEPIQFYWQLMTYPQSCQAHTSKIFLSGLLLLSQIANASGFLWESYQQKTLPPSTKVASCN